MKHLNLSPKSNSFARCALYGAAILGTAFGLSGTAQAGPKIFAYLGQTITFNGTVDNPSNNVDPFTVELFSTGNECLRIAVTAQGGDLEGTLVAPDGRVWQDDDGNGSLRPLIKAITTKRGWHILRLSSFNGSSIYADFTVQVARLASSDPACASPTGVTAFSTVNHSAKPAGGAEFPANVTGR
ncbi:hypothetical protein [Methylocapsa palsarum]|uniref:Uncharacterized protein n=1 Tax=Methylocapsa palsarum TaxID=1612308 RepID=A0A1I3WV13_9HYPH|nr:hypothetical protein [Methylocapsa palsarum]SFK10727.1 hypothetical protein SAMN05444581_102128 [Methylocapsa palsarum]